MSAIGKTLRHRRPSFLTNDINFDPGTLGTMALWLDFSDISTLFQDTGATTPVTALGQSILRINDKSGNGRHFTNSTGSACPTYSHFRGIQFAGNFNGTQYLSSALASTLSDLYRGGAFTIMFHLKRTAFGGNYFLMDSTNYASGLNGMSVYYNSSLRYHYGYWTNDNTHIEDPGGKNETTVQDAEYLYMTGNYAETQVDEDYAYMVAGDVTSSYSRINMVTEVNHAALGAPADGDSPYPVRLGALAYDSNSGWVGQVRRVWAWYSFLSKTNRDIAMGMIIR